MSMAMLHRIRDERGASAVELALVLFATLAITVGVFDIGFATWNWFATQKATQMGVRFAVDNDPVASRFSTFNAVTTLSIPAPTDLTLSVIPAFTVRCTWNGSAADCSNCLVGNCTVSGFIFNAAADTIAFNNILAQMQTMQPRIQAQNLVVDYSQVGLGFAGRPGLQLVPQITVSIQGMSHGFFALDAFIPAIPMILPMNGFASTMTAEDLDTQG